MSRKFFRPKIALLLTLFSIICAGGCAVEAAKNPDGTAISVAAEKNPMGARIKIEPGSPADTVRVFYKNLREKRFREALFLTNLRPAIEGLTESELSDLQVDFASLAAQVPAEIQINGEIISGEKATVTANLPDGETDKLKLQEIKLRKEAEVWIILTVDEEAEKVIKKEGKNYFFALRLETYHAEVRAMFKRISEAQLVYALQNKGSYAEIPALVKSGFLSAEGITQGSNGYQYDIKLSDDKKNYSATATPITYGKTGKSSFLLTFDTKNNLRLEEKDVGGKPLR